MVKKLSISELAARCRTEAKHYKQTGQSNEVYCFELFRRALAEQDETAWEAIYAQYQSLVAMWVRSDSRFFGTGEEAGFFVNAAFTRLWRSGTKSKKAKNFDVLGEWLNYLKFCVWSAIEDYRRQKKKDALATAIPLEDYDRPTPAAEAQENLSELKQLLWETVQNEPERLVAEGSWVYDLTPRQIQAGHPEIFAGVPEVSQIKRNIIRRLKRKIKKLGEAQPKNE